MLMAYVKTLNIIKRVHKIKHQSSKSDSPNFNFFNMGHQKLVKYGANMGHSKKYGAKYGAVTRCFVMRCFEGIFFGGIFVTF